MKTCPVCGETYSERIDFCFNEGVVLKLMPSAMDAPMPRSTGAGVAPLTAPEAPRRSSGPPLPADAVPDTGWCSRRARAVRRPGGTVDGPGGCVQRLDAAPGHPVTEGAGQRGRRRDGGPPGGSEPASGRGPRTTRASRLRPRASRTSAPSLRPAGRWTPVSTTSRRSRRRPATPSTTGSTTRTATGGPSRGSRSWHPSGSR